MSAITLGGKGKIGGKTLFGGGGGTATPGFVQHCQNSTFATSTTVATGSNCSVGNFTSGNTLYLHGIGLGATINAPTAGCGAGTATISAWTLPTGGSGGSNQEWYTATVTGTGSCSIVVTGTGNADRPILIWEFTNGKTTVDGTPGFASGFQTNTFNGPATTTSANGDVCLVGGAVNGASPDISINSPFTSDFDGVIDVQMTSGHYLQPSAATLTPSWTTTAGGTFPVISTICFKT